MSVLRRLVNVAYGKVKTTLSADEGPVVDEVERLRPPEPEPEPKVETGEEPPVATEERKPAGPRPRRL